MGSAWKRCATTSGAGSSKRRAGQKVPQGYYNLADMLDAVLRRGGEVAVCGTCMDARGIAAADKVIVF